MDFLTKKQIEGLATQDLSKEQFDVLFPVNNQNVMTYHLQLLDKGQVEGCLSTDWMDEKHMRALSANQMKSLDLSKVKDELFHALFKDAGEGHENSSRIKDLDLEKQIYPHIDLFKGTQLRTLSSDQIKSLDLKRIRKEHFDVIFPRMSSDADQNAHWRTSLKASLRWMGIFRSRAAELHFPFCFKGH